MSTVHGASGAASSSGRTFLNDHRRWVALAVAVLVAALVVGTVQLVRSRQSAPAPAPGQQAVVPPVTASASPTATAAPTPTPSPTLDPEVAAILKAHADANAAGLHAAAIPDPNDPLLVQTMTYIAFSDLKKNLIVHRAEGIVIKGDRQLLHPQVIAMTLTTATVVDCEFSTEVPYSLATGEPIAGASATQPGAFFASTSYFVMVDGVFKLSRVKSEINACSG